MGEVVRQQQQSLSSVHATSKQSPSHRWTASSGLSPAKDGSGTHLTVNERQAVDLHPSKKRFWTKLATKAPWPIFKRRCFSCDPSIMAWLPEILSLALALLTLLAIVVLLAARQDKTLPRWPSLLQINSLIAIFSSLFKVSLLYPISEGVSELKWIWFANPHPATDFDRFDSASRGPWGSVKLLLREPQNFLTSFGAIIIMLALAIDPFTQQVLQFVNCPQPISGLNASIPRVNTYNSSQYWTPAAGGSFLDPRLLNALYRGILSPPANATAAITASCPSGNCTFPEKDGEVYSSLAFCASIDDITSTVAGNSSTNDTDKWGTWTYILPSGLNISDPYTLAMGGTDYMNKTHPSSVFTFEMLSLATSTNCTAEPPWRHYYVYTLKPLAFRVALAPCIETYSNVTISNNILEQSVIRTTILEEGLMDYCATGAGSAFPGTDCTPSPNMTGRKTVLTTRINGSFSNRTYDGPRCTYYPEYEEGERIPDGLWYDRDCIFSFKADEAFALSSVLHDNFGSIDTPEQLRPGSQDLCETSIISSSSWLLPFWKPGSLNLTTFSETVGGLTSSLSAALREGENPLARQPAQGLVIVNQTCTGVAWAWLALPTTLLVWTVIFLGFTIVISRRTTHIGGGEAGRRPWKSSSSPLLWCGLQDATREKSGSMDEVPEMQRQGNDTHVKLDRYDDATGAQGRWLLREYSAGESSAQDKHWHLKWSLVGERGKRKREAEEDGSEYWFHQFFAS